jgi:Tol biopolymer transport system component
MKTTNALTILLVLLCAPLATPQTGSEFPELTGPYVGQKPPGNTPVVFAPGIVSTEAAEHGAPVFAPDGNEIYWYSFPGPVTKMMRRETDRWTAPETVDLGGNPTMSPDGAIIYFVRRNSEGRGIGYCERTDSGWSEKKWFDSLVSSANAGWEIRMTTSGTVYFSAGLVGGSGGVDICRARLVDGKYEAIESLGSAVNSPSDDWGEEGGFVAPDESYLMFSSNRPGGYGGNDLYISFRKKDGAWTQAVNLGEQINNAELQFWPYVSPDGKFLFYISLKNDTSDIYWVSTAFMDELKPKE